MAFTGSCDLCGKNIKTPDELATLLPVLQVGDVIQHSCQDCIKKVNDQLDTLKKFYDKEVTRELREWLLNYKDRPKKGRILTK